MVAKTPPPPTRNKRLVVAATAASLNPALVRETLRKVDKCVARLQEMQYTVSGGRNTRDSYLRTNLRCKQQSFRLNNSAAIQKSPQGKFPTNTTGEWRRMSLPAMLLGETLLEIQKATRFTKHAVAASMDPRTPPVTCRTRPRSRQDTPQLRTRRATEKQLIRRASRMECRSPTSLPRARTRISFRPISPGNKAGELYHHTMVAHRVNSKHSPWTLKKKKAVLFPNVAFSSSPASPVEKKPSATAKRVMIPGIKRSPPHKFLIKSPAGNSKFQVKIRKSPPVPALSLSPLRSSRKPVASPAKFIRRSFSPSKLANRLASPIKSRLSAFVRKSSGSINEITKVIDDDGLRAKLFPPMQRMQVLASR